MLQGWGRGGLDNLGQVPNLGPCSTFMVTDTTSSSRYKMYFERNYLLQDKKDLFFHLLFLSFPFCTAERCSGIDWV